MTWKNQFLYIMRLETFIKTIEHTLNHETIINLRAMIVANQKLIQTEIQWLQWMI